MMKDDLLNPVRNMSHQHVEVGSHALVGRHVLKEEEGGYKEESSWSRG